MTAQTSAQESRQVSEQASETTWHVVGLDHDLKPGCVLPGFTARTEMAIWRDNTSQVHAFDVRCPHRGMRLSQGFVRNNNLACPYHGWQYGSDGHCAFIPAHPDLPPSRSIRAGVYPCVERYGLIWSSDEPLNASNTTQSPNLQVEPPELESIDENALLAIRSYVVDRPCNTIRDALLLSNNDFPIAAVTSIHPGVIALSASDLDNAEFVVALQTMGHSKTGLHLLANTTSTVDKKLAARWGARLRNQLEGTLTSHTGEQH